MVSALLLLTLMPLLFTWIALCTGSALAYGTVMAVTTELEEVSICANHGTAVALVLLLRTACHWLKC